MIKIDKIEEGYKTYSDEDYMIRPIFDRLGKEINPNAIYDEAEDIDVNGYPRYDYEETDIKRIIVEETEEIEEPPQIEEELE